ncbi:ribonuclease J, partial [Listeria monocytogenes]|nr:ribonuclease J [Listeria monocytogenes]
HRQIQIHPDDTVIFSSSPIPGNTTSVNQLINLLLEAGANVIHGKLNNIHTSGHGGQEEQKLMLRLMKPKFFMPVHGEFRMLNIHTQLAQDVGVPKENCFIMENGDMLALTADTARLAGHFNANDVYVDGSGIGDIGNVVLRDRRILSEEGLVLAVATVDVAKKEVLAGPDILSRGFVYMRESGEMINEAQQILFRALREVLNQPDPTEHKLREAMSSALQPFLFEKTERHPMILSMIMTPDDL